MNEASHAALEEHTGGSTSTTTRTAFVAILHQLTKQMREWPAWETWRK